MSLEEVLKNKKEAEEEAAKPKFLSRKEREKLALQRNRQQGAAFTAQVDAVRVALQQGSAPAPVEASHGAHHGKQESKEHQKELAVIRQQYLGTQKTKRRVAKASDKFRFNFDWEASEDTHEARLHEGPVLFGRGTLAGIDRKAQRELAAKREQQLLSDMRRARGDRTTAADIQADMARANRASHIDDDPVLKEKHWSEKSRADMSARDWRIFREDHRISYKNAGQNAPMPFRSWDEMPLPAELRQAINDLGHTKPFAIQMASIPFGIRQRDVIGIAETGSGKTAAFVLPMLMYIMNQPVMTEAIAADGPYALILAPTRELAQQIEEETISLAMHTAYRTVCIVGGASYDAQIGQLRRGAEIVVATPGRLGDCLRRTYAVLNQCAYVVLDEADRMIDLGFEPQVMDVLAAMPSSNMKPWEEEEETAGRGDTDRVYRTTYMFSATMPPAVERIAKRYLRRPVTVTVGSAGRATDNVLQRVEWVEKKQKPAALTRALDTFQQEVGMQAPSDNDGFKIMVFVNNRENSEEVYNNLQRIGAYRVALLHGGKGQEMREECIKGFRDGEYDVLIATDVAGRGIDVKDVGLVLNYDMPHTIEQYTHRIGRTGRAGRRGIACTFLNNADDKTFFDLKKLLEDSKASIPYQLANHEAAKIKPGQFDSKKDTTLFAA